MARIWLILLVLISPWLVSGNIIDDTVGREVLVWEYESTLPWTGTVELLVGGVVVHSSSVEASAISGFKTEKRCSFPDPDSPDLTSERRSITEESVWAGTVDGKHEFRTLGSQTLQDSARAVYMGFIFDGDGGAIIPHKADAGTLTFNGELLGVDAMELLDDLLDDAQIDLLELDISNLILTLDVNAKGPGTGVVSTYGKCKDYEEPVLDVLARL